MRLSQETGRDTINVAGTVAVLPSLDAPLPAHLRPEASAAFLLSQSYLRWMRLSQPEQNRGAGFSRGVAVLPSLDAPLPDHSYLIISISIMRRSPTFAGCASPSINNSTIRPPAAVAVLPSLDAPLPVLRIRQHGGKLCRSQSYLRWMRLSQLMWFY